MGIKHDPCLVHNYESPLEVFSALINSMENNSMYLLCAIQLAMEGQYK